MSRFKQCFIGLVLIGFAALIGGWGFLHQTIQSDVEKYSTVAQESFPDAGDDVASLIAFMQSETHTLRERNHAVWALGQLRDPRALPALRAAYTGEPCDHARFLCQRELSKAIECHEIPNFLFIHARRTEPQS